MSNLLNISDIYVKTFFMAWNPFLFLTKKNSNASKEIISKFPEKYVFFGMGPHG